MLLLVQCATRTWTQWHYIVPDNYQGFLAIHYRCPEGVPLSRQGNKVTVQFDTRGLFCTSDSSIGTTGPVPTAETYTNRPIPYVAQPRIEQGFIICCGGNRAIGGGTAVNPGPDLSLGLLWIGEVVPQPTGPTFQPPGIDVFLQDRFGLRPLD